MLFLGFIKFIQGKIQSNLVSMGFWGFGVLEAISKLKTQLEQQANSNKSAIEPKLTELTSKINSEIDKLYQLKQNVQNNNDKVLIQGIIDNLQFKQLSTLDGFESAQKQVLMINQRSVELDKLKTMLNDKNQQVEELIKKYESQLASLKQQHSIELQQSTLEKDSYAKLLKSNVDKQLQTIQDNRIQEIQDAVNKATQDLKAILQQREQEISKLRADNSSKLDSLANKTINDLQKQLNDKEAEFAAYRQKNTAAIQNIQLQSQTTLKQLEDAKNAIINQLEQKNSSDLQQVIKNKDMELAKIQAQNKLDIKTAVEEKTKELIILIRKQEEELKAAQKQLQDILIRLDKNSNAVVQTSTIKTTNITNMSIMDLVIDMQNRFNQLIVNTAGSTNIQNITQQQQSIITRNFIDGLNSNQIKLLNDYLISLAQKFNSEPIALTALSYDKIPFVLDQIKVQEEQKRTTSENSNKIIGKINTQSDSSNLQNTPKPPTTANNTEPSNPFGKPGNTNTMEDQNINPFKISNFSSIPNNNSFDSYRRPASVSPQMTMGSSFDSLVGKTQSGNTARNPFVFTS